MTAAASRINESASLTANGGGKAPCVRKETRAGGSRRKPAAQSRTTSASSGHKAMREKKITKSFGLYRSGICWMPPTRAATYNLSIKAIVLKADSCIISLSHFQKEPSRANDWLLQRVFPTVHPFSSHCDTARTY